MGRGRGIGGGRNIPSPLRAGRWVFGDGCGLWFGGAVEAGGAEGVAGPGGVGEACVADELEHAGWAGEAFDRGGEIAVGGGLAGDEAAYAGEDFLEIEVIEGSDEAFGLVAVEDADLAAGAEDAEEFGEALFVVGEVAEAEGGGDEVDGVRGDGEMEGVGLDGDDVVGGELFCSAGEHLVGEVYGQDGGWFRGRTKSRSFDYGTHDRAVSAFAQDDTFFIAFLCVFLERRFWAVFEEGEGHVAGAAAEVEGDGFGALEDGTEGAGGAGPPVAVDAGGEGVVGAVVGGRDGVEHLLDVRCCGLLGGRAGGAGSGSAFVLGDGFGGHQDRFLLVAPVVWLRMRVSMDSEAVWSSASVMS